MKTWNGFSKTGPATVALVAGVLVLATGCVEHRVTYVRPAYPVRVETPAPPPPSVVVTPPPQPVTLPPFASPLRLRLAAELDRMLAPIALYPDPLLAQILPAATSPGDVVDVDRYLREGGSLSLVDAQPWDNSLKALARYPATLRMMAENLAWTTELGQAFLNQSADVMDSIQRLRGQALALGNLQSTPQQTVVISGGVIEILPPTPQVIYVPVYQPEIVYVRPPPAHGRFYVSFSAGLAVGAWLNHDCDWRHHRVIVWHHERPRPADWWYRPPHGRETPAVVSNVTVVNNTTIVNQNYTVWHPQPHSPNAQQIRPTAPARQEPAVVPREDARQPAVTVQKPAPARDIRATAPARSEVAAPTRGDARQAPAVTAQRPVQARDPRPAPAMSGARPTQPEIQRNQVTSAPAPQPTQTISRPAPAPAATRQSRVVPTNSHPAVPPATAPLVASSGVQPKAEKPAAIGTARVTRESTARGRQTRDAIASPAANTRSAPAPSAKDNSVETNRPAGRKIQ